LQESRFAFWNSPAAVILRAGLVMVVYRGEGLPKQILGQALSIADSFILPAPFYRSMFLLPSSSVYAARAVLMLSASSLRNLDGGMPFSARNCRLKFERLLKPT
jgi:hypothetical protein